MAVQSIVKDVAGSAQTAAAAGATAAQVLLGEWQNDAAWVATVELTVEAHGVTSGSVNTYYFREVFEWTDDTTAPTYVGALGATHAVEEDIAWDAVIALNANHIEVQMAGEAAEVIDWSWSGTITLQKTIWASSYPTLLDYSAGGNHLTMTNQEAGDIVADAPAGTVHSDDFGGTDEFAAAGDVLDFEYNVPFSLSMWFKTTSAASSYMFAKEWGQGYAIRYSWTGQVGFELINTATTKHLWVYTTQAGFNDGEWHHVLTTYNGNHLVTGVHVYVDGVDEPLTTLYNNLGTNTTLNTAPLYIGGRQSLPIMTFTGKLCHGAIYDKELSAAEVARIYNGGTPPDLLDLSTVGDLVGWWRLGD